MQNDPELLQRTKKLVQRMSRLGIEKTGYKLVSPFSFSLKRIKHRRAVVVCPEHCEKVRFGGS